MSDSWYTSYPSINHWHEGVGHAEYAAALEAFTGPLHLYLHIPFCKKLCNYCLCNVLISNDREKIQNFVEHICREIDNLRGYEPDIQDVHFGGGTPSHLDRRQFSQLCDKLDTLTDLRSLKEVAMEIDPRTVVNDDLAHYASHGINRISFGVQDYDAAVQKAINREQSPEMIDGLLEARHLFKGVNFDLLYGLPLQTMQTIEATLKRVLVQRPDRITVLKYCHAPEVRRHMKLINVTDLPVDTQPMFDLIRDSLMSAGYKWIGLDHFALPADSLATGKVGRTFNGFTSGTEEMIGLGPTTTSVFGSLYAQAQYDLQEYYKAVNAGEFPILRGYEMTPDDHIRRKTIFRILTLQQVDFEYTKWYFDEELSKLREMTDLVTFNSHDMTVTDKGRHHLREICKVFDVKGHKIAQLNMTRRAVA
jgi:oxygen-independent coproporphyrinogen-3 oxidase